MQMKFLQIG